MHFNRQFQGITRHAKRLDDIFKLTIFHISIVKIKAYETCKEAGWHPEEFDCDQEGNTLDCDWEDNVEVGKSSSDLFAARRKYSFLKFFPRGVSGSEGFTWVAALASTAPMCGQLVSLPLGNLQP